VSPARASLHAAAGEVGSPDAQRKPSTAESGQQPRESLTPESLSALSDAALRAAGPGARPIVTAESEKHV
jgi:hypothetical protein